MTHPSPLPSPSAATERLDGGQRRVAAIDCGTNSIRLLIADIDPATGALIERERLMEIVRLGAGVDKTGRISREAMERTLAATRSFARLCSEYGAQSIRFVATSASRDAENRDEFVSGVRSILGVEPEVVAGLEEARLSFRGATGALGQQTAPYLVVDLGGGSTEMVLGTDGPQFTASLDIGCVRMTERHLHADPPSPAEVAAAVADIDAALDIAGRNIPLERTGTLVGLAGSVTTVTAHALRLSGYDRNAIDGSALPSDVVLAACGELLHMTREERVALPYLHPGRVDIIGAGALVWSRIVARVGAEVSLAGRSLGSIVTSEHDILDGIALSIA